MEYNAVFKKLPPATRKLIANTAAVLWAFPQVRRVVLYGSHAKGMQRKNSDIDLAVFVLDSCYGKALFKEIVKACTVSEMDVQVQVFPLADLECPCGIIEEILEGGVELPRESKAMENSVEWVMIGGRPVY